MQSRIYIYIYIYIYITNICARMGVSLLASTHCVQPNMMTIEMIVDLHVYSS